MWLVVDLVALLSAPALDGFARARPSSGALLTDLARVGLAGLVLLELVPHGWELLGPLALALFVGGAAAVIAGERWGRRRQGDLLVGGAAFAALVAHHVADGVGLALSPAMPALGLAVVLHGVPVSLVAWRLGVDRGGRSLGWAAIAAMVVGTLVGWVVGRLGAGMVAEQVAVGVACALGGGLLHALLHLRSDPVRRPWVRAIGVVLGMGLVALALGLDRHPVLYAMPPLAAALLVAAAVLAVAAGAQLHAAREPAGTEPRAE